MPDLSYGGFCPVALISGQGFAVPGKPDLGVLCHKVMIQSKFFFLPNKDFLAVVKSTDGTFVKSSLIAL